MPEGVFYYNDRPEMDKYYSGLQATRNAWAHVKKENREEILKCLNCGRLFSRLMVEEPKTWSIPGFNNGWSKGIHINVSSDKDHYVMGNGIVELGEEEAIQIIYGWSVKKLQITTKRSNLRFGLFVVIWKSIYNIFTNILYIDIIL